MTGIKVNLINGKSGALEKRIISEGADSSADLYITADAGRCGAMDAKGALHEVHLLHPLHHIYLHLQ